MHCLWLRKQLDTLLGRGKVPCGQPRWRRKTSFCGSCNQLCPLARLLLTPPQDGLCCWDSPVSPWQQGVCLACAPLCASLLGHISKVCPMCPTLGHTSRDHTGMINFTSKKLATRLQSSIMTSFTESTIERHHHEPPSHIPIYDIILLKASP